MQKKYALGGVVLAGGMASRMGFDKAHICEPQELGQRTILEHNVHLLESLCENVWVSCRADFLREGFTCVPDIYAQRGPAGAIHASLLHAKALGLQGILAIACDMPAVTVDAMRTLCSAHEASQEELCAFDAVPHALAPLMTAYWQEERNFVQSLLAVYAVEALPYFQDAVETDKVKLRWIIPEAAQRRLVYLGERDIFFNLNTPKDVETWRKGLR